MNVAIAVMTKTPGLSPVKTRLAVGIGAAAAVEVHRFSARATASVVAQVARRSDVTAYWAVAENSPAATEAWGDPELAEFTFAHQFGRGLGERMGQLHSMLVTRHGAAILVGTDSPQMEPGQLMRAINWLRAVSPRLVLGPARDGGFWLFGGNRCLPFEDWKRVAYSTPRTGAAFAEMISPHGELLCLPRLRDVDVAGDLERLHGSLRHLNDPTPPQQALMQWLEERAA